MVSNLLFLLGVFLKVIFRSNSYAAKRKLQLAIAGPTVIVGQVVEEKETEDEANENKSSMQAGVMDLELQDHSLRS